MLAIGIRAKPCAFNEHHIQPFALLVMFFSLCYQSPQFLIPTKALFESPKKSFFESSGKWWENGLILKVRLVCLTLAWNEKRKKQVNSKTENFKKRSLPTTQFFSMVMYFISPSILITVEQEITNFQHKKNLFVFLKLRNSFFVQNFHNKVIFMHFMPICQKYLTVSIN